MKIFLLLLFLSANSFGATCTTITRNNYVTNQVLTSSALNADFNQVVTNFGAIDGGCITAGTIEAGALNTTDFSVILKGVKEGCKTSYSSASQISIGKCLAAVNGNMVATSIATTASFGCSGCSAEVASTAYYSYIQTGSTGTTLTPLILTTVPNEDGYDNSGNKVLSRFYNNASSDIDQYSIDQWAVNGFIPYTNTGLTSYTPTLGSGYGTVTGLVTKFWRNREFLEVSIAFTAGTTAAAVGGISLPAGLNIDTAKIVAISGQQVAGHWWTNGASTLGTIVITTAGTQEVRLGGPYNSVNMFNAVNVSSVIGTGAQFEAFFKVPITGWN